MKVARKTIEKVSEFFFEKLGLDNNLNALGIDEENFDAMSKKACGKNGVIKGFIDLNPEDVRKIYEMSLN